MPHSSSEKFPFSNSRAARMLREGLAGQAALGRSIRSLGKALGYKQATVLSHMASGRVAVPLERAKDIAEEMGLIPGDFLAAVVAQKVPDAEALMASGTEQTFGLAFDLTQIAGVTLDGLTAEQKAVMKEVAADPSPRRRWLTVAELPFVTLVRSRRPEVQIRGLSEGDVARLRGVLDEG